MRCIRIRRSRTLAKDRKSRPAASPLPAALIAVAYAISDEYHQSFVEGRHGSPVDVLIDSTGVAIAIAMSIRYEAQLTQLAPQPVVSTVMAALWLLLAAPVLAAVGVPLVERVRARTR